MAKKEKRERILILSVDRDNDIGEKAGMKGPVVGREAVLKAASALGLADPTDSDSNAMFEAVRLHDEMKKTRHTEVAALSGDRNVGVESDMKISRQLDSVVRKARPDYALLVTDGSEDEHTLPIIQSRVPILSVNRVIVRQAEQLESGYYKIKDFIEESLENPKYARLVFGLPAIALILYALFGWEGWRFVVGIFGVYLFLKGFKLDDYIMAAAGELKTSFTTRRFAFFTYIVGIAIAMLASYRGYEAALGWLNTGFLEIASAFTAASIYFYFLASAFAWIGRSISIGERSTRGIIGVIVFGFAVSLVIYNTAQLIIQPELSLINFLSSIVLGFILIFVALVLELKR
jgi:putative membrane protein